MQFGTSYFGGNFYGGDHLPSPIVIGGDISLIVITSDYTISAASSSIIISYDITTNKTFKPEFRITKQIGSSAESNISTPSIPTRNLEFSTTEYKASTITGSHNVTTQPKNTSEISSSIQSSKGSFGTQITPPLIQSVKVEFQITKSAANGSMHSEILDQPEQSSEYFIKES